MITTIYREMPITYDENKETWTCQVGDKWASRQDLKECKKAIDKFLDGSDKIKKKFDRFEVLKDDRWNGWELFTVTSITEEGTAWVTDKKGNRSKVDAYDSKYYYTKSENNLTTIELIKQVDIEIKNLEDRRGDLMKSLETFKPKEVLKQLQTN